ncbi:MAG: trypsin-like peptidase domain-containing protein [Chloroflexi bacterium]|nr:trypsin-like peptidase domain-containing protein [Chloroflexota bacterium]
MKLRGWRWTPALLGSAALVMLGFVIGTMIQAGRASTPPPLLLEQSSPSAPLSPSGAAFAAVYENVAPSVVAIQAYTGRQSLSGASGFVLDQKGHIITNNHVVDVSMLQRNVSRSDAGPITYIVEFYNGTLAEAELIGRDVYSDLAVLRVDPRVTELRPVTFADSAALTVGQEVLAIGNPYGNEWTLTTGIISALDRAVPNELTDFLAGGFIQTDAAINPGNSGGPLLNMNGHVIGVNNSIQLDISETRPQPGAPALANSGVGFAIPSNLVRRVAQELIAFQRVAYSLIGIFYEEDNLARIQQFGLPNSSHGVLVSGTDDDTPAEAAGLQRGDLILAIDGHELRTFSQLLSYLAIQTRPGDEVVLQVRRGDRLLDVSLTLAERQ